MKVSIKIDRFAGNASTVIVLELEMRLWRTSSEHVKCDAVHAEKSVGDMTLLIIPQN